MVTNSSDTVRKVVCFLATLLVALILGLAFAHAMEVPGKLRLDGPTWLIVQQNLYIGFGPAAAVMEPLGILFTWILVFMLRGHRSAFRLVLLAAVRTTTGLVVWALVGVTDERAARWMGMPATLPPDWTACRDQWELGHAIHAALFGAALCALLGTMLAKRTDERDGEGGA